MNLALFDFDGTITTREMMPDFMVAAVPPLRLALGRVLLAPWVIGYKLGLVSGVSVRRVIVRFGFSGVTEAALSQVGQRFAAEVLPGVLRPQAMERIAWHKAQGDTVVVVSGALDVYLAHWCRAHDLALLCSTLETREGKLTGRYAGAQCVRAEKARRVAEHYDLSRYPLVYAYGDTPEDEDLLALAHRRYYRWQALD